MPLICILPLILQLLCTCWLDNADPAALEELAGEQSRSLKLPVAPTEAPERDWNVSVVAWSGPSLWCSAEPSGMCTEVGHPSPAVPVSPWVLLARSICVFGCRWGGPVHSQTPWIGSLIQLEALLNRLCCACEAAYRVLHWENPLVSSQWVAPLIHGLTWRNLHLEPQARPASCLRGRVPLQQVDACLHLHVQAVRPWVLFRYFYRHTNILILWKYCQLIWSPICLACLVQWLCACTLNSFIMWYLFCFIYL